MVGVTALDGVAGLDDVPMLIGAAVVGVFGLLVHLKKSKKLDFGFETG